MGSNHRPIPYEGTALTTELLARETPTKKELFANSNIVQGFSQRELNYKKRPHAGALQIQLKLAYFFPATARASLDFLRAAVLGCSMCFLLAVSITE